MTKYDMMKVVCTRRRYVWLFELLGRFRTVLRLKMEGDVEE